jgi:uncharacterized protein (DUF1015 family)
MALQETRVAPFKGVRYNTSVVGDLATVVCPPYDVISPEDRRHYHNINPYNFVRLVLGEEFETDSSDDNRFSRAGKYLNSWIEADAMREESSPAMYVYRQDFTRDDAQLCVLGLICAVKLHEYADQVILPHENTLAKPKSQLIELIRNVRANLDSVYGLYEDPDGNVQPILDNTMSETPVFDIIDKDNVRHRLWSISDSASLDDIVSFFSDKQIAIADGHHRYETALAYSKEARAALSQQDKDIPLASDYTLMTLANVYQKDLTVLPTHRVMFGLTAESLVRLSAGLSNFFVAQTSKPETIVQDMAREQAIGVHLGSNSFTLKLKEGVETGIEGCEASQSLEVNILHKLILEDLLGLTVEDMRNQTNVTYTRDAAEAIERVDSYQAQIAFLLNPVGVKPIMDIAAAGEKMPQKSTYFYPKLISGLVLRLLER